MEYPRRCLFDKGQLHIMPAPEGHLTTILVIKCVSQNVIAANVRNLQWWTIREKPAEGTCAYEEPKYGFFHWKAPFSRAPMEEIQ
ncbi:hypothetical protein Mapa_016959 [Marchantia paleacea]|nr:hypothetical protein Mapa_016959 [Marchantia paleacea]